MQKMKQEKKDKPRIVFEMWFFIPVLSTSASTKAENSFQHLNETRLIFPEVSIASSYGIASISNCLNCFSFVHLCKDLESSFTFLQEKKLKTLVGCRELKQEEQVSNIVDLTQCSGCLKLCFMNVVKGDFLQEKKQNKPIN